MTVQDTTRSAYDAALAGAVWLDLSHHGRLEIGGADRLPWLQGLLTNDMAALAPGQGCYAAFLTAQGRMIADLRLLAREESLWADVPAQAKETLLERLDMFVIAEDVTLRDITGEIARIGVHGPVAAGVVAAALVPAGEHRAACVSALEALGSHAHLERPWHGVPVLVAAQRDFGVPGFDVYVAAARRDALVAALAAAGAMPTDEEALEPLRLEAARPKFGADLDESTIPLEAGLAREAISFTKGCYVGQEIIVRMRDRGQGRVAKQLMRLWPAAPDAGPWPAFAAGDVLVSEGREVGRVTSAAWSPRLAKTIGLGYVQRAYSEPCARIAVRHGDALIDLENEPRGGEPDDAECGTAEGAPA